MSNHVYEMFEGFGYCDRQKAIEEHEGRSAPLDDAEFETKPVSMRLPLYKIAALEAIASKMDMSRQDLIMRIVESSLGSAIGGYAMGWADNVEHPEQVAFEYVNSIESISARAKSYLFECVCASFDIPYPHEEIKND